VDPPANLARTVTQDHPLFVQDGGVRIAVDELQRIHGNRASLKRAHPNDRLFAGSAFGAAYSCTQVLLLIVCIVHGQFSQNGSEAKGLKDNFRVRRNDARRFMLS
jgi:hypothetical protein